jgi:hypothetical protein
MIKTRVFSNIDKTIKYGFIYDQEKVSTITIDDILSEVSKSILIYDTKGTVFYDFASKASKLMNNPMVVFAALLNHKMLQELKSKGIVSGFYRSTSKDIDVAMVIVDKTKAYLIVDSKHIIKISDQKVASELFQFMNHVLWSRADFEVLNNSAPKKINEIRLSVVIPSFHALSSKTNFNDDLVQFGTQDFSSPQIVMLSQPKDIEKDAYIINQSISSLCGIKNEFYVKLFDDMYAPIGSDIKHLVIGRSFNDSKIGSLIDKNIWFDGKKRIIEKEKEFSSSLYKPVDEYKTFEPDFDQIYKQQLNEIYGTVKINVDVKPMVIDASYQISAKYKKRSDTEKLLAENLSKLKKLADDDNVKIIDSIINTKLLLERISKYNKFLSLNEFGEETLKNKKANVSKINIGKEEISVPQELLGKLYTKSNKQFLAIKDETMISDAKKWLSENNQEATLVLGNE